MPTDGAFRLRDFHSINQGLLVVSETLVTLGDKRGLESRSMMESWNRNVSSANLGICVVLRRGGEVSDQHNSGCL